MVDMSLMRPATMEECHALLLEAIKYIDDICRKEGITYYAAYGTLLGAVREHGFIAWDHDADLWMKREDRERFAEALKKYPNPKYSVSNGDLSTLMRIYINDTLVRADKYSEYDSLGSRFHVDIFSLDFGFGDDRKNKRRMRTLTMMRMIVFRTMSKKWKYLKHVRTLKNLVRFAMKIPMQMIPLSVWVSLYKRVLHNASPDEKVLISTGGCYSPEREIYDSELFKETIELPFEDMMIKCPAGYDELLTQIYGDYMTPYICESNSSFWVKA